MIDPRIFRSYDIRGKVGGQITGDVCRAVGWMFGTILRERYHKDAPSIVVGRDARTHSPGFLDAAVEGLLKAGCHVLLMGQTPSPLNYFTICARKLDGGLQITASHNPKDDNGIKLQVRDAEAFAGEDLQTLRQRIAQSDFLTGEGRGESIDAVTPYIDYLGHLFDHTGDGRRIVVDGGNGVAGPVYCEGLRRIGAEVIELFTEPNGDFPNHPADPSSKETLRDLQEMVKREKTDLGFAFDGDGDRLGVVDERGAVRASDEVLLLLAKDHLSRHHGAPVIFTVSNSATLQTEIEKWGGKPVMTKVGHSHVEHAMREYRSLLGGEQSGHFFCGEGYFGFDDALVAAMRLLSAFGKQPLSKAMEEFPAVYASPELRPHCDDDAKAGVVSRVTEHFSKTYPVSTLDGARIDFGGGAWAGIRQSNTSPCLSICMEARSEEKLSAVEKIVMGELRKYKEIRWEG